MPKIIWKGCSSAPYTPALQELPPDAQKIQIPVQYYWLRAMLLAAPFYVPVVLSLYLKNHFLHCNIIDKGWLAMGLVIALLLGIVHEWLHCLPYPRQATAYIGILPKRFMAYMSCTTPLRRNNDLLSSLLPVIWGFIPWIIFLLCPATARPLASLCWGCAVMGMVSPCPDYLYAYCVYRQVPPHGWIQAGADGCYWYCRQSQ